MRKTAVVLIAVGLTAGLACSDKSPTSPMAMNSEASSAAAGPASVSPVTRNRNTTVLLPRGDGSLPPGIYGSAEASLAVNATGARLEIFSGNFPMGGCFGKYADIVQFVPGGAFNLGGTFTQLTGVYPGRIDYTAQFSGTARADVVTITVFVPSIGLSFGPYSLVKGVTNSWTPCLYP